MRKTQKPGYRIANAEDARTFFPAALEAAENGEVEKVHRYISRCNLLDDPEEDLGLPMTLEALHNIANQNNDSEFSDRMGARQHGDRPDLVLSLTKHEEPVTL